jgi:1-phosphofructokinase family hexose kinase
MIYTLSINPAVDMTIITDVIKKDRINKTKLESVSAGGKGFNTSRALNCLDIPNTTIAFCGGVFSRNVKDMLNGENISSKLIPIDDSIRVNIKVVENVSEKVVEFNERGPFISSAELENLMSVLGRTGRAGDHYVVSGSLPRDMDPQIYKTVISILKKKKIKAMLDTSGEALYRGIKALPDIIKVNREEMAGLCSMHDADQEGLARTLIEKGVVMIMVTDGPRDTFYYDSSGKYRIKSPDIKGPYKTGAGDSVNAGIIYSLEKGLSLEEMLRFAVACGNANILNRTPGMLDRETVYDIAGKVKVVKE